MALTVHDYPNDAPITDRFVLYNRYCTLHAYAAGERRYLKSNDGITSHPCCTAVSKKYYNEAVLHASDESELVEIKLNHRIL